MSFCGSDDYFTIKEIKEFFNQYGIHPIALPKKQVIRDDGSDLIATDFSVFSSKLDTLDLPNNQFVKVALLERDGDEPKKFEHSSPLLVRKNEKGYDVITLMPDNKIANLQSTYNLNVKKPLSTLNNKPISPIALSGCFDVTFFTLNGIKNIITPEGEIPYQEADTLADNSPYTTDEMLKLSCSNKYITAMQLQPEKAEEIQDFRKNFNVKFVEENKFKMFSQNIEDRIREKTEINVMLSTVKAMRRGLLDGESTTQSIKNFENDLVNKRYKAQNTLKNTQKNDNKELCVTINLRNAEIEEKSFKSSKDLLESFIKENSLNNNKSKTSLPRINSARNNNFYPKAQNTDRREMRLPKIEDKAPNNTDWRERVRNAKKPSLIHR